MLKSIHKATWPSLSVIIPSYNQGRYIERTLLSILKQNYPGELQVIVSDGGSTDETVEVLKKYPQVQWWSAHDSGFADAVTKGLAVATGEIIGIQSSDDYYLPGAFVKALAVFQEQDPQVGFVAGGEVVRNGEGYHCDISQLHHVSLLNPGALIAPYFYYVPQHATFIRRSAIDSVSGLRPEVDQCADFDLWYRILHFHKGLLIPEHLAVYQKHPAQRTQSQAEKWIRSLQEVVESCEREEFYAHHFRPSASQKKETFWAWRVNRHYLAGGPEDLEISLSLAREVLKQKDQWSEHTLATARSYKKLLTLPAMRETARKLKSSTPVRRLVGKKPLEEARRKYLEDHGIQVDWWREPPQAIPAGQTALSGS